VGVAYTGLTHNNQTQKTQANMNNGSDGKNHPILKAFEEIEKLSVKKGEIAKFTNEDDFIGLGVSLLIEAGSFVCVAANTLGAH
jgi:hypothetical protein